MTDRPRGRVEERAYSMTRGALCAALHRNGLEPEPGKLPGWLTQEDFDYYLEVYRESGFRGPCNYYRNIPTHSEITPELEGARFKQPAAFVAGAEDDVLLYDPDWREKFPKDFDDLRFIEIIEGAGHWVQAENPTETTAQILRFLGEIDGN